MWQVLIRNFVTYTKIVQAFWPPGLPVNLGDNCSQNYWFSDKETDRQTNREIEKRKRERGGERERDGGKERKREGDGERKKEIGKEKKRQTEREMEQKQRNKYKETERVSNLWYPNVPSRVSSIPKVRFWSYIFSTISPSLSLVLFLSIDGEGTFPSVEILQLLIVGQVSVVYFLQGSISSTFYARIFSFESSFKARL